MAAVQLPAADWDRLTHGACRADLLAATRKVDAPISFIRCTTDSLNRPAGASPLQVFRNYVAVTDIGEPLIDGTFSICKQRLAVL